jgi:hypothetical protein
MARPAWIDEPVADPAPVHASTTNTTTSTTEPPRASRAAVAPAEKPATPTQSTPSSSDFVDPWQEIWGQRSDWKSRTVEILDPETGIPTGRTQQIFVRVTDCPENLPLDEWLADLDAISRLVN